MLNIAICDDDAAFLEQFSAMVKEYLEHLRVECAIDCFTDAPHFLKSALKKFDIVFLDVKIADFDGLDVARALNRSNQKAVLIFISAYIDYATKGYEVKAFRYLIKNEKEKLKRDLEPCLQDTLELIKKRKQFIRIKTTDGQSEVLLLAEIWFIESQNHNVIYHTADKEYITYGSLGKAMEQITSPDYLQVQRSFIVNLRNAINVHGNTIEYPKGKTATMNRKNKEMVMAHFLMIQGEC